MMARFIPVFLHVRIVPGERPQHLLRHPPDAFRQRQHGGADIGLAFADDVDEGLAVESQSHRLADVRIVERR
jgi:hypothetical protein